MKTTPLSFKGSSYVCYLFCIVRFILQQMHPGRFKILCLFASKKIRYAVAGITFLFIVFMVVVILNFIALTPQQLYKEAYIPFIVSTVHGAYTIPTDSTELRYEKGDYRTIVQKAKKRKQLPIEEQFLLGLSYMHLNDYGRSIQHLIEVEKRGSTFASDASFYLSMVYLLNQDYDKAIEKMEAILSDKKNPYHARITEGYIRKVTLLKWK